MRRNNKTKSKPNNLLQQLVALNRQQMQYPLPNTPDLQFPTLKQNKVHTFVSDVPYTTITTATGGPVSGAISFSLSQFPDVTAFTGLFDTYRIIFAKVIFNPISSVPPLGGSFATAIDYDDASSSAAILSMDTSQQVPLGHYHERNFVPRVAIALYSGAFTSFGQMKKEWIDQSSATVVHYGLKYTTPVAASAVPVYDVQVRIVLQTRNNF